MNPVPVFESGYRDGQVFHSQEPNRAKIHSSKLNPREQLRKLNRVLKILRQKWLRKSEQGDKWNRCLIEGMIVLSETGARDEQTTPP